MAEITPTPHEAGSVEAAAESLRGILSPEPESPPGEAPVEEQVAEAVETEETSEIVEVAETEAEAIETEEEPVPAILPPSSWSEADRAVWASLPPEVQKTVARRESERDSAFQQRSQEDATARREMESVAAQLAQERQHYADQLATLIVQAQAELTGTDQEAELDRLLEEGDTYQYELQKRAIEKKQARLGELAQEQQRIQAQQQQEQLRQIKLLREDEEAKLASALPAWSDPAKAKTEKAALGNYLKDSYGYTDEDLGMIFDHRYLVIAHKARLYDQLRDAKPEVAKKVKTAKPVVRPGSPESKSEKSAEVAKQKMDRLRQNPTDVEAAADIFRDLL